MRGWTARVGLRKPGTPAWARSQLNDLIRDEWDELIESAHLTPAQVNAFQPWVRRRWLDDILAQIDMECAAVDPSACATHAADWADALLGQMRWPGDPDHVDVLAEAMDRPIDHDVIAGKRSTPRPCCHTTGPNHHPACQEER